MADPVIKFKRSSVSGKVPTTAQLPLGELAINTYDGKVFVKKDTGGVGIGTTVVEVGAEKWIKITTTYTATSNTNIIADTSGGVYTITLPASPSTGDVIRFADGDDWDLNNLTVGRNGNTIEGTADNLILDVSTLVTLIYDGSTWQVYSQVGPEGPQGTQGYQGHQGHQGSQGSQGADSTVQGPQGFQGDIGAQGSQGSQGSQGDIGAQGYQGYQGDIGVQGSQGYQGVQGSQGSQGAGGLTTTDATTLAGYSWTSSGKNVRATEFYADNWFRNYNAGEGLYNEATGCHFVSDATDEWTVRDGGNSIRIEFQTNGTSLRGSLYADNSNQFGFLNNANEWGLQYKSANGNSPNLYFVESANETWTGNPGSDVGKIEYHSNRFYIAAGSNSTEVCRWRRSSTDVMWLDNSGNLTASGNLNSNSDIKLKTNIKTLTNSLERVLQMRGVEYDRIDLEGNPHQIGVIAQEVEEVAPELVSESDGIKNVSYGNITALLIEAVKEQQILIENQNKRIKVLEGILKINSNTRE